MRISDTKFCQIISYMCLHKLKVTVLYLSGSLLGVVIGLKRRLQLGYVRQFILELEFVDE